MSTQMPTLFDDEDFWVPPPKKEVKSKKNVAPTNKNATEEDLFGSEEANIQEAAQIDTTVIPDPIEENELTAQEDMPEAGDTVSILEEVIEIAAIVGDVAYSDDMEPAPIQEPEAIEENATTAHSGISFEIPEEDEVQIEMEAVVEEDTIEEAPIPLPIPGIKEDVVDDLDKLLRTEIIAQDYSAFSAFSFEPNVQKKTEVEIADLEIEKPKLSIKDLDSENLEFDLSGVEYNPSELPEFQLEDKYYTIGEVAEMFAVNVSHIRFWTTEFKLKVRTTRKGDRLYNPENIARLRLIHHLVKENKYTIKGAKEQLKTQQKAVSQQVDLKDKLSGLKDKLERIKRNL